MTRFFNYVIALVAVGMLTFACEQESLNVNDVPQDVIDQLTEMGFNPDGIIKVEEGYLIERDIIITPEFLSSNHTEYGVPNLEQYRTTNLVSTNGNRVINIYAPEGGGNGYSAGMIAGLDLAIARYNAEGLEVTFQRVTRRNQADIKMTRLSKFDESRGILGSAGFPTSSGDPYGEIKMSGILESTYGLSTEGIATIIAHEMGHCIGFRHTDYFDRSISCGGPASNEGQAGVGAIHIPGTPTGADLAGNGSYMLSCTDGSDRPFTSADRTALGYLY